MKFTSEKGYTYEIEDDLVIITAPESSEIQPKKLQLTKTDIQLMLCRIGVECKDVD